MDLRNLPPDRLGNNLDDVILSGRQIHGEGCRTELSADVWLAIGEPPDRERGSSGWDGEVDIHRLTGLGTQNRRNNIASHS